MSKKTSNTPTSLPSALLVSRKEAEQKIDSQISKADAMRLEAIASESALKDARQRYYQWDDYTRTLLPTLFSGDEFQREFTSPLHYIYVGSNGLAANISEHRDDIGRKIGRLQSIRNRLELLSEPNNSSQGRPASLYVAPAPKDKVFLVHGHNREMLLEAKDLLRDLGVEPVILSEKANLGQTIVEKFEREANRNVKYAVVLMTDDDLGEARLRATNIAALKPRARQNVILELGSFMTRLGRGNVAVLYSDGVEMPSDYSGVAYISFSDGEWRTKLVKELTAAGINVDHGGLYGEPK
jgi:predicted nucleotide-binding protein